MVAFTPIALSQAMQQQTRLTARIGELETSIATGKRYVKPSDAPAAWTRLSMVSRQRSDIAAIREPLAAGISRAREADRWMASLVDDVARVQEIVVAAGGTPGVGRAAMLAELQAMRQDLPARFAQRSGYGLPLLDATEPLMIDVGDGRLAVTVPQSDDIAQIPGVGMLDAILDRAIAAVGTGDPAQLASALTDLDSAQEHLSVEQARQGLRMQRLEDADSAFLATDTDLASLQSAIGNTDIAATITQIQTLAIQRDAARALLSRTASSTLFDYLG